MLLPDIDVRGASYIGPRGEVKAICLDQDHIFPSGSMGKKGEWILRMGDGSTVVSDNFYFVSNYRQKFPRINNEPALVDSRPA